ncbi:lytic murein transglycosylase [Thalassotalea profundi]|uniref:Lytic transglycosylase n=1 Tax=Thalassotalea profundi TaxID=2036687 RepID=A0ABQ3IEL1_9GAMM|nr:lytic murein transglycosylase [Thalassotalea profundi]GHE79114.1 lytic transglycosylase [Thalassotalea profundi]
MQYFQFPRVNNPLITKAVKCTFLSLGLFSFSLAANDFEQCKLDFQKSATELGYSDYIIDDVISSLSPIERVQQLDKSQPEFSETFAEYISKRVTDYRLRVGKQKLNEHKALLDQLTKKYGVPSQYLVAFWGLETNYGSYKGKMPVLNSIATLACDKRRSRYFTAELFNLFDLIDQKSVTVDQLQGSWAGAMGHMQFMPTALKAYGIDGDNDGKVDVWESEADALTSAANYLSQIGWRASQRWGRKVTLPENFDYAQIEQDKFYPLSDFKKLGVTTEYQQPLSNYAIDAQLFLPAGHNGPAFLVYPNFNVIMKWNLSKNYATAVGLLANSLVGAKKQQFEPLADKHRYTREQLQKLQEKLQSLGYKTGKPDGIWGPNSRKAIRSFQLANNLVADAYPNQAVFDAAEVIKESIN